MAGAEEQVDLGGPRADAANGRQLPDRLAGRKPAEPRQVDPPFDLGRGYRPQRRLLGPRQPDRPAGIGASVPHRRMPSPDRRHGRRGAARSRRRWPATPSGRRRSGQVPQSRAPRASAGGRRRVRPPRTSRESAAQRAASPAAMSAGPAMRRMGDSVSLMPSRSSMPRFVPQGAMPDILDDRPVFRFAPSPNGLLHLGHALSALVNFEAAREMEGRFLLRIEDIDLGRCRPAFEAAIFSDLAWLGLRWEEPVRRQSQHFGDYRAALDVLIEAGLVYPSFLTRSDLRRAVSAAEDEGRTWPRDPDGAPLFPTDERRLSDAAREEMIDERSALRLAPRHGQGAGSRRRPHRLVGDGTTGRTGRREMSSPILSAGATSCWRERMFRSAITSRLSSMMRCRASRMWCAAATSSTPRPCTGSCRSCSGFPPRSTTTTGLCSATTAGSFPRAEATRRSRRCAKPASRRATSGAWSRFRCRPER